jgi:hypothetical protein
MPPNSKRRGLFSRFVSFLNSRSSNSAFDSHPDSRETAGAGVGLFQSDHASTRSVPLPLDTSTPECHESQPQLRQSRSEDNIIDSSQSTATTMAGNQALLRPRLQPFPGLPVQQPSNKPLALEPRSVYGGTSFYSGTSVLRMGGTVIDLGAGHRPRDGMSIPPR